MGQAISKGSGESNTVERHEALEHKIILQDVVIRERKINVDVPVINYVPKEVEYEKPVIIEKETIKYNTVTQETTKYNVKMEDTVKFNTVNVMVEKPVIVEKEYEKPIVTEKPYEKPIIVEKTYELHSVKNVEEIKAYTEAIKELNLHLPLLMENLKQLRDYKLVEQIIRVPKLDYETVKVERIEWVPIKREKEGLIS